MRSYAAGRDDVEGCAFGTGLKVLMLAPHPGGKGPLPKHTPVLIESMRRLGCEVTFEPWGHRDDRESLVRKLWDRAHDVVSMGRAARRRDYDIIVIKTGHDWRTLTRDIPLLLATRGTAQKQVVQFHGSSPHLLAGRGRPAFKAASRVLLALCDAIMVLSREEERAWKRFYASRSVYVVANPLVPGHEAPPASPSEEAVILFVGRLVQAKGVYDLVDAAVQLLAEHPDWRWRVIMAGDGPESFTLQKRIEMLGLEDRVSLTGYLGQERLNTLYHGATIFALPSYFAEGFPTVVTEAMSASLPIVTTRIRGVADYLEEGINALFVRPQDPAALFAALERLLGDQALRGAMAQANREKVKIFAPEIVARDYVAALWSVLDRRT